MARNFCFHVNLFSSLPFFSAFDNDVETELKKVQDLRKELETILDKNNKMTTNLQQQYIMYKRKFSDGKSAFSSFSLHYESLIMIY